MRLPGPAPTLFAVAGPPATTATAANGAHAAQNPEYQVPELQYLAPFPVVRLAGRTTRTGSRITLLRVRSPRGSTATVRCSGGRRLGCPFSSRTRTSPASRVLRFRGLERPLKAGVRLNIFVRRGDAIGKHTRFTIRKRKPPSRVDGCILPGDPFEPAECP